MLSPSETDYINKRSSSFNMTILRLGNLILSTANGVHQGIERVSMVSSVLSSSSLPFLHIKQSDNPGYSRATSTHAAVKEVTSTKCPVDHEVFLWVVFVRSCIKLNVLAVFLWFMYELKSRKLT